MYLVFTRMPGESYRRRMKSVLLCLCYVFRALINTLVCCLINCREGQQGAGEGWGKVGWGGVGREDSHQTEVFVVVFVLRISSAN